MSALPPHLLNQVNKALKEKTDRLALELQRNRSLVQLEQEVLRVTSQKLADANFQRSHRQTLAEKSEAQLQETQRALVLETKQVQSFAQQLISRQAAVADTTRRAASAEDAVAVARSRLQTAEALTAEHEEAITRRIEDTQNALSKAGGFNSALRDGDITVKQLRREVELLRAQTKQIDDALRAQEQETRAIYDEREEAARTKLDHEREAVQVRGQIADALFRAEEQNVRMSSIQRQALELEESRKVRAEERTAAANELRQEEASLVSLQRAVAASEFAKNQKRATLQEVTSQCDEALNDLRLLEVEAGIVESTKHRMERVMDPLRADLERAQSKLGATLARKEALLKQLKELELSKDDDLHGANAVNQVVEDYAAELRTLIAVEERGKHLLQQQHHRQRADAEATDHISGTLARIRRMEKEQTNRIEALRSKWSELGEVNEDLERHVQQRSQELAAEQAKRGDLDFALRKGKQVRIQSLQLELQEWERTVRQTKQSLDAARSALHRDTRSMTDANALIDEMRAEAEATARDVATLHKELDALQSSKIAAAESAEDALVRFEKVKAQAASMSSDVAGQLTEMRDMEVFGRSELARLEAEDEGRRIELHSHEDDRRRLARRLYEANSQHRLLRSRYADMMNALSQQVHAQELQQAAALSSIPLPSGNTTSRALVPCSGGGQLFGPLALGVAGNSGLPSTGDDNAVDPDELEARHLMLRAMEREALQQKGDALDREVVMAEKQSKMLDAALHALRTAIQRDHETLRRNRPEDLSPSSMLALLGGDVSSSAEDEEAAAHLVAELREEQAFLRSIQETYRAESEQLAESMRLEISRTEETLRCHQLELARALTEQRRVQEQLREAREARQRALADLRRLERQHGVLPPMGVGPVLHADACSSTPAATRAAAPNSQKELSERHRLTRAVIEKQRLLRANPEAVRRLDMERQREMLVTSLARLLEAAARKDLSPSVGSAESTSSKVTEVTGCYASCRLLCERYNLLLGDTLGEALCIVTKGASGVPSAQRNGPRDIVKVPSKTAGRRQDDSDAVEATNSSLEVVTSRCIAVRELTFNRFISAGHSGVKEQTTAPTTVGAPSSSSRRPSSSNTREVSRSRKSSEPRR